MIPGGRSWNARGLAGTVPDANRYLCYHRTRLGALLRRAALGLDARLQGPVKIRPSQAGLWGCQTNRLSSWVFNVTGGQSGWDSETPFALIICS